MRRRRPSLLLLLALVGGLGAASVHRAHHAAEWAASRAAHLAGPAHGSGDHASTPCDLDGASTPDCAVCGGLSGAALMAEAVSWPLREAPGPRPPATWRASATLRVSPARGPPAA